MQEIVVLFMIALIGYLIGCVTIKGIRLGTSAVLLVAIVFGHFGFEAATIVRNFGLVIFVGAVGLMAGPVFFRCIKRHAFIYMAISVTVVLIGATLTWLIFRISDIPKAIAVGIFTGAFSTTPGLAASLEALGDPLVSVGYGIAYPFGVVGVVLFVQLMPRMLCKDLPAEVAAYSVDIHKLFEEDKEQSKQLKILDSEGLIVFCIAIFLGLLLGRISIPLPGAIYISLGITGGPLFGGLVIGSFRKIGNISLKVPNQTLRVLRELGLLLFLLTTGLEAGGDFVAVVYQYGWELFAYGIIITLIPMFSVFIFARKVAKMGIINLMGAICGGMTSTPALGALMLSTKSEDVTVAYAAAYPFALISVVIVSQILVLLL